LFIIVRHYDQDVNHCADTWADIQENRHVWCLSMEGHTFSFWVSLCVAFSK